MVSLFSCERIATSWMSGELWDKRELSTQCGEACIFVLNEVWSHSIRLVLLHVHCAVVVSNSLDVSVLSNVRFSNMATEWGGYITCTFFWSLFFIPSSLCYFDVSHYFHGWRSIRFAVCGKRTSVVRRCCFVCPMSPFVLWMSLLWWRFLSWRCCKRVHFIWSSAFTILFCLVCDVPCRFCCL